MKWFSVFLLLVGINQLQAQPLDTSKWYWIAAGYGTPVITQSTFNQGGILEIKAGTRIIPNGITLVGGLENTLSNRDSLVPERFSPFFGPGYMFKDDRIFFSIHTGLSYPLYKNAPEYPRNPGLYSCIDIGIRIVSRFTIGIGLSNQLAKDVNAFNLRFWVQLNSD